MGPRPPSLPRVAIPKRGGPDGFPPLASDARKAVAVIPASRRFNFDYNDLPANPETAGGSVSLRCAQHQRELPMKRYAYLWLTLAFFLISIALHWYFGWQAFVEEASQHGDEPQLSNYLNEMSRDTFENWQSEFLQLMWQVVGLAYFLYVGSPSSKENDDRVEAKVDALLRINAGDEAEKIIKQLDKHFERGEGALPHGHNQEVVHNAGKGVKHVAV
jgi:hypothetical protein